jgi:hypothetical protein
VVYGVIGELGSGDVTSGWNGERRHFDTSSPERFKYYGFELGVATD